MTSPQLENGYVAIANELFDQILRFPFTKRQLLIVFAVIRKTYGFRKMMDDISLSQLAIMTRLDSGDCSKTINELCRNQVLVKRQGRYGQLIGINKHYGQWKVSVKHQGLVKHQEGLGKTPNTKDNSKRQYQQWR